MDRYPFEPLEALIKSRGQHPGEQLRLSGSRLAELRTSGLSEVEADRYACRVGALPFEVWDSWYQGVDELAVAA